MQQGGTLLHQPGSSGRGWLDRDDRTRECGFASLPFCKNQSLPRAGTKSNTVVPEMVLTHIGPWAHLRRGIVVRYLLGPLRGAKVAIREALNDDFSTHVLSLWPVSSGWVGQFPTTALNRAVSTESFATQPQSDTTNHCFWHKLGHIQHRGFPHESESWYSCSRNHRLGRIAWPTHL